MNKEDIQHIMLEAQRQLFLRLAQIIEDNKEQQVRIPFLLTKELVAIGEELKLGTITK